MPSGGNYSGKDKSLHGLLVGLGIAGTIAGVAILFAYAASSDSYYPQGPAPDSAVQNVGQPALPSQKIDSDPSNDAADRSAVADNPDIAGDSLQQVPAQELPDKSQAMKATESSEIQMPEEQPPTVVSVAEQADANATTLQDNNSSDSATIASDTSAKEELPNRSVDHDIKDESRQEITSGGIVSIGAEIDKAISPPVLPVQVDDHPDSQDNHHGDKVKVQKNDEGDKNSKEDKHVKVHEGKEDKHGDDKKGKNHEKKNHKGHD